MNWDGIVAVSQLVAALGVIVSLIFLAVQLRQNTKAVKASSIQNLIQSMSSTAEAHVESKYLVPILLKANAGWDTLTEEEQARLHFWFVMAFRRFEGVYFQRQLGLVDSSVTDGFERSHISILSSKSGHAWWAEAKEIFNSGFVTYVDEQLRQGSSRTLHPSFRVDAA